MITSQFGVVARMVSSWSPTELSTWIVRRLMGADPYFTIPSDDEREYLIRTLVDSPDIAVAIKSSITDCVRCEVQRLIAEHGWNDPASELALVALAQVVLPGTLNAYSDAVHLYLITKDMEDLSVLHARRLLLIISLGYREPFFDNYLSNLYARVFDQLEREKDRALISLYEGVVVQGLSLVGAERLLAWVPQIKDWTPAIEFQLDLALSRLASPLRFGPEKLAVAANKARQTLELSNIFFARRFLVLLQRIELAQPEEPVPVPQRENGYRICLGPN